MSELDGVKRTKQAFAETNYQRSREASKRDAQRARDAIRIIQAVPSVNLTLTEIQLRQRYLQVLRVRLQYPTASLQQLAGQCRVGKDVYSARLKRAFAFADKMKDRI